MITIRVLGPVEVSVHGRPAPPELLWRKHLALLIYLARSPKRARTREHLTGLLWPEKDESAARHSLNEALRVVRRVMGEEALPTGAGQVRLDPQAVRLDTDDLERWIATEQWAEACAVVAGEFLEGFGVPGCERLEEWLTAERRRWAERSVLALLGGSDAALRRGAAAEALSLAERATLLEPHSDAAVQAVMRAYAIQGEAAAALAAMERFSAALAQEVHGTPAAETLALADRIRTTRRRRVLSPERSPGEPVLRRAPLTGRGRELGQLLALWERCRHGAASAIVLDGESGVGKTRLIEEFSSRVKLAGATVGLVRAVAGDAEALGSGILGLARGGLLEAPGLAAAPAVSLAAFAAALPEWAERFPDVTASAPLSPTHAMIPVLEAILGESPVLLVVDDAHWADPVSLLALIGALRTHASAPLMVLLAALSHPPRDELDELRRRVGGDVPGGVVTLGPLDGEAIRALAAWTLPGYDALALERLCRRIGSDSAGMPFLVVELLSAVAQGLELSHGPAAWPVPLHTLTQTLPGDLPESIVAALRIGFRRLSSEAQRVLSTAAVLGDRVTEAALAGATDLGRDVLERALDELEFQRWLEVDARGYGFVARVARVVIERDMVTPGQRARILERAGSAPAQ